LDAVKFYVPVDTNIDNFRDILSQSLRMVLKKLKLTKTACINKTQDIITQSKQTKLTARLVIMYDDQPGNRIGLILTVAGPI